MSVARTTQARIAIVQFDPQLRQVQRNVAQAERLTRDLQPGSVDLLCLPEMAFTGYSFPDLSNITPYLEYPESGTTFAFCSSLAQRLRCYVAAGFPERIESPNGPLGANAALVVAPDGRLVTTPAYRKTNLFYMDVPWAQPGTGFAHLDLPTPLGRTALGICMDLNPIPPGPFTSSNIPYEFADFIREKQCDTAILLCNWLDPDPELGVQRGSRGSDWSVGTVNYWAGRLAPLFDSDEGKFLESSDEKEVLVVICNRTGVENGTTFAGTSTLMRMSRASGEPEVLGVLKRTENCVRVWTIDR